MPKKFHSDSSAKRIAKNGAFITIRFGVYTLSGILFIPFLIRQYGSGTYGLIALAGFLTQYVGLVSRCVGNSTARFLNVALNQNDWKQANEIFSTALMANLGFILIQLPLFALGIWKLHWLIDFPPEITQDFRILVTCNVAVFFTSMLAGVFMTPIQAANRVDISSTIDAFRLGLRLVFLYVLIKHLGAKLWLIGVVDLVLASTYGAVVFFLRRRLAPDLVFKWKYVTKNWIRPVLNMAGWSMVTVLGSCLFVKTDVWMINRFVNKEMAGIYAALLVWPNFLKQVGKQLASVLTPVYMIDYARGDWQRVARLSLSGAKLLGCFAAVIAGFLYVVADPLLRLWLGEDATQFVSLFRVMTLYLTYTIGSSVLWQIYITLNKVHFTGIVNIATGVINILVSMVLIRMGFGAMGVAAGTVFSVVLASTIAIPLGVCHEFKVSYNVVWWNYICASLVFFISLLSTASAVVIAQFSRVGSAFTLIILLLAGLGIASKVILSGTEKAIFTDGIQWLSCKIFQKTQSR
jgi:membrane protein EpsK